MRHQVGRDNIVVGIHVYWCRDLPYLFSELIMTKIYIINLYFITTCNYLMLCYAQKLTIYSYFKTISIFKKNEY